MHELRSKEAHHIYFDFSQFLHTSSFFFSHCTFWYPYILYILCPYILLIKRIFWFYIIRCCLFPVNLMTAILVPVPSQTAFSFLVHSQGGLILQICPMMTRKVLLPEGCPGGLCSLLGSLWQPPAVYQGSSPCSTDSIMARRTPSSGSSPWSSPSWKVSSSHNP